MSRHHEDESQHIGIREFEAHAAQDHANFRVVNGKLDGLKKEVRRWGLMGGFLGGVAAAGVHLLGGCQAGLPPPGRPSDEALAAYSARLGACIATRQGKADIDACRAAERALFCGHYPNEANCVGSDAGGE